MSGDEHFVDIRGSLGDNPTYRNSLANLEGSVSDLESNIKALLKLTKSSLEHARAYQAKSTQFANELLEFAEREKSNSNDDIELGLEKFGNTLKEIQTFQQILISQTETVLMQPLDEFVKKEIGKLSETRKKFQKHSDDYDSTLSKYVGKKPKDPNWNEAAFDVADSRKSFHHASLEYAMKLNEVQAKKKFEVMERILAFMFAQQSFFHHGFDLLKDLEPFMKQMSGQLQELRSHYQIRQAKEEAAKADIIQRSSTFYNPMQFVVTEESKKTTAVTKEGYLFKKGSQVVKQSWDRRYFCVQGDLLIYYTRGKDEDPIVATNLRLCSVKPSEISERRFCFSVMSPIRSYTLQAETEEDYYAWMTVLQNAIGAALNSDRTADETTDLGLKKEKKERLHTKIEGSQSVPELRKKKSVTEDKAEQEYALAIQEIKSIPGNHECADCGQPDPEWASINHGVLLCIECSGIHRSLGVHISKVRSITLDKFEPDLVEAMKSLGNTFLNSVLLARLNDADMAEVEVPNMRSDRATKEKWIAAKYVERKYVEQPRMTKEALNMGLYEAAGQNSIQTALKMILQGADVTKKNPLEGDKTPLHNAVISKSSLLTEFLMLWTSDVDVVDANGYSPLHYAASLDHIRIVLLLAKRAANFNLTGKDGKTPFDLAQAEQNEDVLVVFRLIEANGGGREALEKTLQLLQARNTRASLRMSQHRVRKPVDIDTILANGGDSFDGESSPIE